MSKITDLTALTGANSADGDLFVIVDVSDTTEAATGTAKSITLDELEGALFDQQIIIGGTSTNGLVRRSIDTGTNAIYGGESLIQSANIVLYGGSHATQSKDISLQVGANVKALWDDSDSRWEIKQNILTEKRLLGTQGADVASAGTVTLGDGNYFDITGTTAIDYITTTSWTAGSTVILQFDGSVTVNHNTGSVPADTGAILLSGAGNFSATAGDTLMLVYDGTTWREVSRTVI